MVNNETEELLEEEKKIIKCCCETCKTSFYTVAGEKIEECCFCNSKSLTKTEEELLKLPKIVPFVKDGVEAVNDYKKRILKNPFVPLRFRRKKKICKMKRLFIPAILSNVLIDGKVSILAGDKEPVKKDKKKYIEIKKYNVIENVHIDYKYLLFPTYTKIDEKLFHTVCNYDYKFMVDYNDNLLKDSSVVMNDLLLDDVVNKEKEGIFNHSLRAAKDNVNHHLLKIQENKITERFYDVNEVLVPIYLLTIKYRGKQYKYIMNGQSGKSILESAFSILSIIIFGTVVFSIFFIISTLIAYFL